MKVTVCKHFLSKSSETSTLLCQCSVLTSVLSIKTRPSPLSVSFIIMSLIRFCKASFFFLYVGIEWLVFCFYIAIRFN